MLDGKRCVARLLAARVALLVAACAAAVALLASSASAATGANAGPAKRRARCRPSGAARCGRAQPRAERLRLHAEHVAGRQSRARWTRSRAAGPEPVRYRDTRSVRARHLWLGGRSADLPGRLLHRGRRPGQSPERRHDQRLGRRLQPVRLATNNCVALDNFWRSLSNLTINVAGGSGCQSEHRVLGGLAGGADAPGRRSTATCR